jgi:hypothetical protein
VIKCEKCGKEFEAKTSHSFRMETCFECQKKKLHEMYLAYPVEEYTGQPFFANGEFCQNIEDFYELCKRKNLNPDEMEIVKAQKVEFPELDINDFLCDYVNTEESDLPEVIIEAAEKFNEVVKKYNQSEHGYYDGIYIRIKLPAQNAKTESR